MSGERTPENLPRHEWIGLDAEVVDGPDPTQVGISGTVVDETRETVVLDGEDGRKRIAKPYRTFALTLGDDVVEVDGSAVAYRPEDRTKKVRSR